MRILVTADVHGSSKAIEMYRVLSPKYDLVIIAGDVAPNRRPRAFYPTFKQIVRAIGNKPIVFVAGNADPQEALERNPPRDNVYNVHASIAKILGLTFTGIGGSTPTPFKTPNEYPETRFDSLFVDPGEPFIFVTHVPPRGINDAAFFRGVRQNVGSLAIRRIVEDYQPILHAHGHVHEARGIEKLGDTICVNPGPAKYGFYAHAEIEMIDGTPIVKNVDLRVYTREKEGEKSERNERVELLGLRNYEDYRTARP